MDKNQYGFLLVFSFITFLGLVSFVSCLIAESKKAKKEDIRFDNKLCQLPPSHAIGFGFAALICLVIAQIIGSLVIFTGIFRPREHRKAKKQRMATILLAFSWISFGIAVTLLGAATSMSRRQPYGKGWLDDECYLVKDGVYIGSGVLALVTTAATLSSAIFTLRKTKGEQGRKIHAQSG